MRRFTISVLVSVVVATLPVLRAQEKEQKGGEADLGHLVIGEVKPGCSLRSVLWAAGVGSGLVFCTEDAENKRVPWDKDKQAPSDKKAPWDKKDWAYLSGKPVKRLIADLERLGFSCARKGIVVLVVAPRVKTMKDNPLDKRVNGFKFKGTHEDFVTKLAVAIRDYPDTVFCGYGLSAVYDIDIKGELTARDVLLHLSAKYGMGWDWTVRAAPLTHTVGKPDEGSRWTLGVRYPPPRGR